MSSRIIIFDTEFTTWEGAQARRWTGQTPSSTNEYRELVQIGAIKADWPSGEIIDTFDQLIKPTINPQLSDYFIELTGITQEDVDARGIDFPTALQNFIAFIGMDGPLYSYGNDMAIIGENVALNHCAQGHLYGARNCAAININYFVHRFDPNTRPINSGGLANYFGVGDTLPPGAEHNALFNCYSILAALLHLRAQGAFLPIA